MKVYIAGSSDERESRIVQSLRDIVLAQGHHVPHDWTVCEGLQRDCTPAEKGAFADNDAAGVAACDIFWLVAPPLASEGAFCELGIARALGKRSIVSGPYARRQMGAGAFPGKDRIFCYSKRIEVYDTHEAALAAILGKSPLGGPPTIGGFR